jgi:hypothetical protein
LKVTLRVLESDGTIIESYTSSGDGSAHIPNEKGMNDWTWDLRYPSAHTFDGMILWGGGTGGPRARPGNYSARLVVGEDSMSVAFDVLKDPRTSGTEADIAAQFEFLIDVRDKLTETHEAIEEIRDVRSKVEGVTERVEEEEGVEDLKELAEDISKRLTRIEEALYQTKNRSNQDPLNYPIRLNNRLSGVVGGASSGDYRPTEQSYHVRDEVTRLIDIELELLREIMENDIPELNRMVREKEIPAIKTKKQKES